MTQAELDLDLAYVKGSAIIFAAILISFGGIVTTPTTFLIFIFFKSFLTSEVFICWKSKLFKSEPNVF